MDWDTPTPNKKEPSADIQELLSIPDAAQQQYQQNLHMQQQNLYQQVPTYLCNLQIIILWEIEKEKE